MARTRELILPRRSQPQGAVALSAGYNTAVAFVPGVGVLRPQVAQPSYDTKISAGGIALSNRITLTVNPAGYDNRSQFTTVLRLNRESSTSYALRVSDGVGWNLSFSNWDVGVLRASFVGAWNDVSGTTAVNLPIWIGDTATLVIECLCDSSSSTVRYLCAGNIYSVTGTALDPTQTGAPASLSLFGDLSAGMQLAAVLKGVDRERSLALLANPWSLFAPIRRRVPLPGAAPSGAPDITFVGAESILSDRVSYRATLNYA